MKLILCIVVMCFAFLMAKEKCKKYDNRYQRLVEWKQAMLYVKGEISYCMTPFPEICHRVGAYMENPVGRFF